MRIAVEIYTFIQLKQTFSMVVLWDLRTSNPQEAFSMICGLWIYR